MKILGGLVTPSAGEILIDGNAVAIDSPRAAQDLGLGMVPDAFPTFPDPERTVAENIVMDMESREWGAGIDDAKARAVKIIEAYHFSIDPDRPVRALAMNEKQQVQICRLLYRNAGIVMLDEPTAGLSKQEAAAFFRTLRALALDGKSLLLITHYLEEIKPFGDRVVVLRRGELAGIRDAKSADEDENFGMTLDGDDIAICPPLAMDCNTVGVRHGAQAKPDATRPLDIG